MTKNVMGFKRDYLVRGFILQDWDNMTETVYALYNDGAVYERKAKMPNPNFDHHAATWKASDVTEQLIMESKTIEFCGNYYPPKNIKA